MHAMVMQLLTHQPCCNNKTIPFFKQIEVRFWFILGSYFVHLLAIIIYSPHLHFGILALTWSSYIWTINNIQLFNKFFDKSQKTSPPVLPVEDKGREVDKQKQKYPI